MHIQLQPSRNKKTVFTVGAIFVVALLLTVTVWLVPANTSVQASQLEFEQVQVGDLAIYADSFGELVSSHERLLTAPAQGQVIDLRVRPGMPVSEGTIIMQLANP